MCREIRHLPRYAVVYILHKCLSRNRHSGHEPMWDISSWTNSLGPIARQRKVLFAVLLVLILFVYLRPNFLGFTSTKTKSDFAELCVDEKLSSYQKAVNNQDAVINHKPLEEEERAYLPYVGNGKIATAFGTSRGLFIRLNRALSLEIPYHPIIKTVVDGTQVKEAYVLDFNDASAQRLQAVRFGSNCFSIGSRLYAHRTMPSVLVQSIRIHNPSDEHVTIKLEQPTSVWKGAETNYFKAKTESEATREYTITMGTIPLREAPGKVVLVGIATGKGKASVVVGPRGSTTLYYRTVVHYTEIMTVQDADNAKQILRHTTQQDMEKVLGMDAKTLHDEHVDAWRKLWSSGFTISLSKAAGALNGDIINSTIYYVLSNVRAPLHDVSTPMAEKLKIWEALYFPDRCYDGHPTLQADKLWSEMHDETDVANLVTTWMITLEKQGCSTMIKSGAEGVLQAMLLSLGALKFNNDHLEFLMHPKELHRDFFFRRINYGNNTHVNISVVMDESNKAILYVALDRNDKPYYACDAGCIDSPVPLTNERKAFPVKLTDPLTAILYITADEQHMKELKHAIHVKEINEAPAQEHHVMALHKHGHRFGGLPTIFWVSISFLIIIFHLFLFKLIYNEYCSAQERYTRGKYNL